MFSVVNQKQMMQQEVACSQCALKLSVTCCEQQEQNCQLKPFVRVIAFKQSRFCITSNNSCLLLTIMYLCVVLSSLRSCRSCRFNSRSACFSTSQQQCSHYLLHLHHLHNRHQSTQYSGARPQLTLQLRGNHHQHHKAGLHWWVVSEHQSVQR